MQERLRDSDYPFLTRIRTSTGIATTGIIGAKRQSIAAFGDTVNLASLIKGLCEPGYVTIDEATYNDCRELFEMRPVSGLALYTLFENSSTVDQINGLLSKLERMLMTLPCVSRWQKLLLQARDPEQAATHLKLTMKMAPGNDAAKVAYAENALILESQRDLTLRGRRRTNQLYEVVAFKTQLITGHNSH
jgi:hypothetical protein